MRALTRKSEHGRGYSVASRDIPELVTKLGEIEATAYDLINEVCDRYCKYVDRFDGKPGGEDRLIMRCERCPLYKLANLIYKGDIGNETPGEAF